MTDTMELTYSVQLNSAGAFERFVGLLNDGFAPYLRRVYELHGKEILEKMIADAAGEEPSSPPGPAVIDPTRDERFLNRLLGLAIEVSEALATLADSETYLRRSGARKNDVPAARYVRYHFEHYLEEKYILRNRLNELARWLGRKYQKTPKRRLAAETCGMLEELVDRMMKNQLALRGAHVHEKRIDERELRRLSLLTFFADANDKFQGELRAAEKEVKRSKAAWMKQDIGTTIELVDVYFNQLIPLVFDAEGLVSFPDNRPD